MSFAMLACMDGSRRQPLKPLHCDRWIHQAILAISLDLAGSESFVLRCPCFCGGIGGKPRPTETLSTSCRKRSMMMWRICTFSYSVRCSPCRSLLHSSTTLQQRTAIMATLQRCAAGTSGQTSEWYITEVGSQLFTNSDIGTCQYCTVRLRHPVGNKDLSP